MNQIQYSHNFLKDSIYRGSEFWFLVNFQAWNCQKISENAKFIAAKIVKMAVFGGLKSDKIDFT